MALSTAQWFELCKVLAAPLITGFIGVFSVLITQSLGRKNDHKSIKEKAIDDMLKVKISNLEEILDRMSQAEVLLMLVEAQYSLSESFLLEVAPLLSGKVASQGQNPYLLKSIDDKIARFPELIHAFFLDLLKICHEAAAAAERVGKLPDDLQVEMSTDLIANVTMWKWANFRLASSKPNDNDQKVKELVKSLKEQLDDACRGYKERLSNELHTRRGLS